MSHDLNSVENYVIKGYYYQAGMIRRLIQLQYLCIIIKVHTNKELNADLMDGVRLTDFNFGKNYWK